MQKGKKDASAKRKMQKERKSEDQNGNEVGNKDSVREADLDNGLETSSDVIYDCVDQWQSIIHILRQQFQKLCFIISICIHWSRLLYFRWTTNRSMHRDFKESNSCLFHWKLIHMKVAGP